ncbi:MAG: ribosome small subunit-dependent GTPase A [Candidatus Atabeyarchaeum deiterrae]
MHQKTIIVPSRYSVSMDLKMLGWDSSFEEAFHEYRKAGLEPARIVSREGSFYTAVAEEGELKGKVSGRLRYECTESGDFPVVGDWVAVDANSEIGLMTIRAVLPRRSKFMRATYNKGNYAGDQVVCANVDYLFIVIGLDEEFNANRLERYLAQASASGSKPVVILNKTDLTKNMDSVLNQAKAIAREISVIALSAKSGAGLNGLRKFLSEGKTGSLVGISGVGKSTIINSLLGEERFDTNDVREYDGKGRHTTKHRELVLLPEGGMLIDNPGMRGMGVTGSQDVIAGTFADIEALAGQCKFNDCQHKTEPGCAIRAAIADGTLSSEHFENYKRLQRELRIVSMKKSERARLGKDIAVASRKREKMKKEGL